MAILGPSHKGWLIPSILLAPLFLRPFLPQRRPDLRVHVPRRRVRTSLMVNVGTLYQLGRMAPKIEHRKKKCVNFDNGRHRRGPVQRYTNRTLAWTAPARLSSGSYFLGLELSPRLLVANGDRLQFEVPAAQK